MVHKHKARFKVTGFSGWVEEMDRDELDSYLRHAEEGDVIEVVKSEEY